MIPVADPFMQDAPVRRPGDFYRTVKGVPLVADPNGKMTKPKSKKDPGHVKRVMYRRPSGFGKQIENTYNLQKWGERQEALGFAIDFNLLKQAVGLLDGDRDSKEWKDEADQVVVAAKQAAKAWIAADRGTHTHGLAEDDDQDVDIISRIEHGETLGLDRSVQVALVEAWREMLVRNGLEIVAVEFAVVNDHYKAAGTGDRVAKLTRSLRFRLITGELVELPAGTYVILDIKTGQYRRDNQGVPLYWQSYAVQVALYAPPGACLYDPDTDTRTPFPWPVSEDWAVIAHLDVLGALDGNPSCELILVDLAAGRRAADLCVAARNWETEATVFSVAQLDVPGDGTPISATPGTVEGEAPLDAATDEPSPSTPVSPLAANAVECPGVGSSADQPPHPPATLPDEGDEIADLKFTKLEAHYKALTPAGRAWITSLVTQAQQAGVSFHTHGGHRTARRYRIIRGLVMLANHTPDDDVLRALLVATIVDDAPLHPANTPGAAVGALGAAEASRFTFVVDEFIAA